MRAAKIGKALRLISIFLLGEIGLWIMVLLNSHGLGFLWGLAMIPYSLVLFLPLRREKNLPILGMIFPPIDKLIAHDKQYHQNLYNAVAFADALEFYGLPKLDQGYLEQLARDVPATEPNVFDYYANQIVKKLNLNPPDAYSEVLLLLYRENAALNRWHIRKNVCARELASVLLKSERLTIRPPGFLTPEEFAQLLLLYVEEFTLHSVNELVATLTSTWSTASAYITFLSAQGIVPPSKGIRADDILRFVQENQLSLDLKRIDPTSYRVLVRLGRKCIEESFPNNTAPILDSFSLISLKLFAARHAPDKPDWQSQSCREAATHTEAAKIVLAYLQFSKEAAERGDGSQSVRLKNVIENWHSKIADLSDLGDGLGKEIDRITHHLEKGDFPNTLRLHIDDTLKYLAQNAPIGPSLRVALQQRPWLRQALNRVVTMLRPATIKRFLEARTVNPYFITFDSKRGEIAVMLDALVSPEKREQLKTLNIEPDVGRQLKYNFKQYTRNIRIGVVPRGKPFEQFCKEFNEDFKKLIEAQTHVQPDNQLRNMELIIHQFDLSPRNYFGFVIENITRERAIQRLKELFGDILETDELLAMIEYQGDISLKQVMTEAKLSEIVGDLQGLSSNERKTIEKHDNQLQQAIAKIVGNKDTADLGWRVLQLKKKDRDDVVMRVGAEFQSLLATALPRFDQSRLQEIVKTYVETMAAIATI